MSRELRISKAFVFFGAAILNELDDEEDYRSHQQEVDHAALVQQKFGDDPDDKEETTCKPEHVIF